VDRVLRNTAANIQATFALDGVPTDAVGTVTVTVTRADGTVIVNAQAADKPAGTTGVYQYPLTPTHTALLDTLTATWTGTISGVAQTVQTVVEVAGGFAFSVAQARSVRPLDNATTYTTARIVEMRTLVEDALERELGYALVTLRYTTGFARWSDALVGLEHGQTVLDPEATRAALTLLKAVLVPGPVDERTAQFVTDDGTSIFTVAGRGGSIFGLPSVDSFVQRASLRAGVA
jgi:hypothetical protein